MGLVLGEADRTKRITLRRRERWGARRRGGVDWLGGRGDLWWGAEGRRRDALRTSGRAARPAAWDGWSFLRLSWRS